MSQRKSASRPASRRSPKTSPERAFASPGLSHPSPPTSILPRDDSQLGTFDIRGASAAVKQEGGERPSSGARTSDVHGILNASELDRRYPAGTASLAGQPTEGQDSRQPTMGGHPPRTRGGSPFHPYVFQQGPTPATSVSGYPPPASETSPGIPVQRGSPTTGPSLPPLGVPRRILTPRSPRVTSLGRAARRAEELQQNPLPRQPSLPEFHEVSPRSRPAALGPAPQPPSSATPLPPPTLSPIASRSLSQPLVGHTLPPTLAPDYFHPGPRPSLPGPGPARFPSQPGLARDTPGSTPTGEPRWATGNYGSLVTSQWARGVPIGESQPMFSIKPQYGEEIVVQVDTHQGSKTQDQKRQKNAIASARFRTRKKERENQLEADNHELTMRVREMETERDFYRNERNRLRDIVSRTPSISSLANGPPSPVSTRDGNFQQAESGSTADVHYAQGGPEQPSAAARRRRGPQTRSPPRAAAPYAAEGNTMTGPPRPQGHAYPHPPPYSYGPSEPSMAEPPARRRRLDEPQFTTPTYGPPPPTTLPPMVPTPYGPPSRHPPTPPGLPRLPPLRMDQPSPGSEHLPRPQPGTVPGGPPPPPQQQQQQAAPQPPYYGRPYETGWAQAPPGPQEGGQR